MCKIKIIFLILPVRVGKDRGQNKYMKEKHLLLGGLVFFVFLMSSCVDTKRVTYFNGLEDRTISSRYPDVPEPIITSNDVLNITISSANPESDIVFNTPNNIVANGQNQVTGYLVDKSGFIYYPFLGRIKVTGLTKEQLRDTLVTQITSKRLLIDPIVNIRFSNFRVTILGEVKAPGVVSAPDERLSLLEALGKAGDLTPYARKENVLVIREEAGKKVVKRINLNDQDELFQSQYYYLKTNDVVYAESNAARVSGSERSTQVFSYVLSGVTLLVAITSLILRFN